MDRQLKQNSVCDAYNATRILVLFITVTPMSLTSIHFHFQTLSSPGIWQIFLLCSGQTTGGAG